MKDDVELWSMKEQRVYSYENTKLVKVGNTFVLATPAGELLVTRIR